MGDAGNSIPLSLVLAIPKPSKNLNRRSGRTAINLAYDGLLLAALNLDWQKLPRAPRIAAASIGHGFVGLIGIFGAGQQLAVRMPAM